MDDDALRAELERHRQTETFPTAFARIVAEFFGVLIHSGMHRDEAQAVTQTWVNAIVMAAGLTRKP